MRRLTLLGWFLVLNAALFWLWQYRFERSKRFATCELADLRVASQLPQGGGWEGPESKPRLRLQAPLGHSGVATRLMLPISQPVDFLHIHFRASAKKLKPGPEFWEDGRCLIEWHSPGGHLKWENDSFCSARYDQTSELTEVVMRPERAPAIPVLRIENLGVSGDFELAMFEATVLQERLVWKIGRWFLLIGWLGWVIAWIGPNRKISILRSFCAAMICVLMAIYFVIPGPWNDVRSLVGPFQLGPKIMAIPVSEEPLGKMEIASLNSSLWSSGAVPSVGRIPIRGDFSLRLKLYAQKARPLLHVLLLFIPTFMIACLVGGKPATSLAIILSLAIEVAQLAFDFGFDWLDVFDLLSDAIGILLALWAYRYLKECRYGKGALVTKS
jgi:hypothetical protein